MKNNDSDNCQLCYGASGGIRGNENVRTNGLVVCDYCDYRLHDGSWLVIRHGGRSADRWRIVFRGAEEVARAKYQNLSLAFRRGSVALVSPTKIAEVTTA